MALGCGCAAAVVHPDSDAHCGCGGSTPKPSGGRAPAVTSELYAAADVAQAAASTRETTDLIAASAGMEPSCRPLLWPMLIGLAEPSTDAELESEYQSLSGKVNTVDESLVKTIDADMPRTIVTDERRSRLRALLLAHCVFAPSWGYFQGMNEVGCVVLEAYEGGGGTGSLGRQFWLLRGVLATSSDNWARADLGGVWMQARAVRCVLQHADKPLAARLEALEGRGFSKEQPLAFLFGPIFLRLKRELATLEEAMRLWEVCWASGRHFHIFVLSAFVMTQRKQLMRIRGGGAEVHHLFNQLHGKLFAAPLLAAARVLRNASSVSEQVDAVMMKAPDDSVPATPAAPGGAKTLYAL